MFIRSLRIQNGPRVFCSVRGKCSRNRKYWSIALEYQSTGYERRRSQAGGGVTSRRRCRLFSREATLPDPYFVVLMQKRMVLRHLRARSRTHCLNECACYTDVAQAERKKIPRTG